MQRSPHRRETTITVFESDAVHRADMPFDGVGKMEVRDSETEKGFALCEALQVLPYSPP